MAFPSKICSSFSTPILFIFHLCIITSAVTDTISRLQPLSDHTTVISKGGSFELGFFYPGNTGNLYAGIWFRTTSKKAVIWVANRDNPVSNASSPKLKIYKDGNLVLLNKFGVQWSSNSPRRLRSFTVAVLLDNGNLILRDQDNSSHVIWQSFDHPTDTVLSGQGFGMDKITGEYQNRVSWKDPEDPAPGLFSNHVDLIKLNQYVLLWNNSKVYWQSDNWTGQAFTSIPGMPLNSNYSYVFINNSRQLNFIYTTRDVSIITRIVLNFNGQLQRHTWSHESEEWIVQWSLPAALCDVYSVCGPFGVCKTGSDEPCHCLPGFRPASSRSWGVQAWSQGCVRQTDIQCANPTKPNDQREQDAFLKISNIKISGNPIALKVQSKEECRSICLSNCTCTAYAHEHVCIIWNSELWDLKQLSDDNIDGVDIYIRVAPSDLLAQDNEKKTHHVRLTVIIAVLGGIFVVLCSLGILVRMFQNRNLTQSAFSNDDSLVLYDYSFLKHCTMNFSDKLGQGSFGSVFKGLLPDSKLIAVKKLEGMRQGEKQFQTEVRALGRIHHTNLVPLGGFCLRGAERLLVYDFMVNGSLDSHLFKNVKVLGWNTRFQVILGVAKGLHYLHEKCHECIIHCDIKPENVLLHTDFSPKLADFGLAKLMDRNFSRALTTVRGTI